MEVTNNVMKTSLHVNNILNTEINQSINQSLNQSINQSINQSNNIQFFENNILHKNN